MNRTEQIRILKEAEAFEADFLKAEKEILEDLNSFIDHAIEKEYII